MNKELIEKLINGGGTLADEDEACKDPCLAYLFALKVPGANIEKCQEAACKDPEEAYCFARFIPGANIEKCQESVFKYPGWAYWFAKEIPGANLKIALDACKGTEYKSMMNELIMNKALK